MESLDLTQTPPRSNRLELAGVTTLPRTIDKIRATLPGGKLGEYTVEGFSTMMLEMTGIDLAAFEASVAAAADDEDVATFVRAHASAEGIAKWNEFVLHRLVYGGDRERAVADHPWLAERPEITHTLDFLDEDDRRSFATA